MKLVIAEKPSVAQSIARVIGAAGDHNLTMKLLSLIFADQRFKLFDEFIGFLVKEWRFGYRNGYT